MEQLTIIDLHQYSETAEGKYTNIPLNLINDHICRLSVMTHSYFWHYHPNSDESFLVLEGILVIDLQDQIVELHAGQLFTVPKNVPHKTRPKGARSVNLTFELTDMQTCEINDIDQANGV
jgi:mannose-6-phosphate isomerase-like protein (cupin superfamily)